MMYTGISAIRKGEADGISVQPHNQANEASAITTINLVGQNG